MNKAELTHANEITRECKAEEQSIADMTKETVHDVKKGVDILAKKTENLDIKDIPERFLPSAEKVDKKLENMQDSIEEARHAQVHDKNLENYSKIQQVMKDTSRVIQDQREFLKEKTEDDTLSTTAQDLANLANEVADQSWFTLDKLWTNWAALVAVVAAGGAGSWAAMAKESGRLLNDLRHTEDFVRLLNDLQVTCGALMQIATKSQPVGDKVDEISKEWEGQRDKLLADLKNVWEILAKSPIWNRLVAQGNALREQAKKVAGETKEQVKESADKISESENLKKLNEDLKNILQLIVGKNGPSVQPFLDYSSAAWDDIMNSEIFSQWASEANSLFEVFTATPEAADQEVYQRQLQELHDHTKEILDNTVRNENLRLALRESRKLIKAAKKDPTTAKLIADSQKLIKDISNKKGTGIVDPELLNEIRAVIVPVLINHFDNAPLPDFHGFDKNALGRYDYHLTGIRLGTTGLVPSKVKVQVLFKAVANPSKLQVEEQHTYLYLDVEDIQVTFKDVKWKYNRQTIPRFSDQGTIDLCTAGKGISLKIKAEVHDYKPPQTSHSLSELLEPPKEFKMFDIVHAECNIDDFHVRVSDSGSNPFYELLAGVWGTKIKHQIEMLIESKLHILASRFDKQLYDIVRRTTQPSLTQEVKASLLSAGKAVGEKLSELPGQVKSNIQSM